MNNVEEQEQVITLVQPQRIPFSYDELKQRNGKSSIIKKNKIAKKIIVLCVLLIIVLLLIIIGLVTINNSANDGNSPNCNNDKPSHNSTRNSKILQANNVTCNSTIVPVCNTTCNNTAPLVKPCPTCESRKVPVCNTCNNTAPLVQSYSSCNTPECYSYAAQLLTSLDTSVNPCENFYQYACGNWIKRAESEGTFTAFTQQQFAILRRFRKLLQSTSTTSSIFLTKARKAYSVCMKQNEFLDFILLYGEIRRTINGLPIIEGQKWAYTNNITNYDVLFQLIAQLKQRGWPSSGVLFEINVMKNLLDSNNTILEMRRPSPIPFRNDNDILDLLKKVSGTTSIEVAQRTSVKEMVSLAYRIKQILILSPATFPESYEIITIGEFSKMTKNVNWLNFFNILFTGIKSFKIDDKIAVYNTAYFKRLFNFLQTKDFISIINLEVLIVMNLISIKKTNINKYFREPHMKSSNIQSSFASSESISWPMCVDTVMSWFSTGLAVEYMNEYYDISIDDQIKYIEELAGNLIDSFQRHLEQLAWFDKPSRKLAIAKLANMKRNYLFPNWAQDPVKVEKYYQNIGIGYSHYVNFLNVQKFFMYEAFNKLNSSRDTPEDWNSNTLNCNAAYVPISNSFFVNAAILQPPIYHLDRLYAMNYGGIGAIIGHELTHGFDLTGTKFNQFGNRQNLFTSQVNEKFQEKSLCFVNQYSKFNITVNYKNFENNISLNGNNTASENIADNGGLQQSFWAYQKWSQQKGPEIMPDSLRNFTPEQIFFISYSQIKCDKEKDNYDDSDMVTFFISKHSPNKFRVLGPLANFEEFNKAFNCPPINKKQICTLW